MQKPQILSYEICFQLLTECLIKNEDLFIWKQNFENKELGNKY